MPKSRWLIWRSPNVGLTPCTTERSVLRFKQVVGSGPVGRSPVSTRNRLGSRPICFSSSALRRSAAARVSRLVPGGVTLGLFLVFLGLHDDADAVVGEQERDVFKALGDREEQERQRRLRVSAQHARRHPQLRAVVGTDVFLELVQQAFVVHLYRCLPLVPDPPHS